MIIGGKKKKKKVIAMAACKGIVTPDVDTFSGI